MGKFILGVITVLLVQTVVTYVNYRTSDLNDGGNKTLHDISMIAFHINSALRGEPVVHVLTERCTNRDWDRDRGITARQWFSCNTVQVYFSDLIFGEE